MFWSVLRRFWAGWERVLSMPGASFEIVLECFEKVLGRLGEGFEHARSVF